MTQADRTPTLLRAPAGTAGEPPRGLPAEVSRAARGKRAALSRDAAVAFTVATLGAGLDDLPDDAERLAAWIPRDPGRRIPPAADSEACRVRLGSGIGTAPEILAALAADASVTVRAAVALNPSTPSHVDAELAQDADERVRALLALKLASLVPDASRPQRDRIEGHARATLALLVEDEAVRVRAAIATALAEMPGAPRELVLRLANDRALPVCDPVIRLSPLLSEADLAALVTASPHRVTGLSVAQRGGIGADVSDALAATADSAVIAALLSNRSAAIREATLDGLVARAAEEATWHEPLVHRPALSRKAAQALSHMVATHLLETLARRADLGPELTRELGQRLAAALAPSALPSAAASGVAAAMAEARRLADAGRLTEAVLLDAVRRGDVTGTTALLAAAAEVAAGVVEHAVKLRSVKGLVSLVWRAGFSMRLAQPLQMLLTRLGPGAVLGPRDGGGFPLPEKEMQWQIEFLTRSGQ